MDNDDPTINPEHGPYYLLKNGEPVHVSFEEWVTNFKNDPARIVAQTEIEEVKVSTVFLGLDHNFLGKSPLLFETMVIGGQFDGRTLRYSTLEEAMHGHDRTVALVKGEISEDED